MKKVKLFYKVQTIILLIVMMSLVVCITMGSAFADTELPILDLENSQDQLEQSDLSGYARVIANKDVIRQNKSVFENYICSDNGQVVIPERDNESKILAYQLVGFEDEKMVLYPLYEYGEVDKMQVNYKTVFNSISPLSVIDGDAYDYMSTVMTFYVFSKSLTNKVKQIATVKIRLGVDYFPTTDATYNYYVAKYEVCVMPWSNAGVKSFVMSTVTSSDQKMDEYKEMTNSQMATIQQGQTFGTGIKSGVKIDDNGVVAEIGDEISIGFSYSISAPADSASLEPIGVDSMDNFEYMQYKLDPNNKNELGSGRAGKSYTSLIYRTYRVKKSQSGGLVGIMFDQLLLKGNVGQPSFDKENTEIVMALAAWENPFDNKKIMLISGKKNEGKDKTTQYYGDISHSSSLPNGSDALGVYIYSE